VFHFFFSVTRFCNHFAPLSDGKIHAKGLTCAGPQYSRTVSRRRRKRTAVSRTLRCRSGSRIRHWTCFIGAYYCYANFELIERAAVQCSGMTLIPGGGLVVKEEEPSRAIFALFEEHGSVQETLAEIGSPGRRLKTRTARTGRFRPGGPFTPNSLYAGATSIKGRLCMPGSSGHGILPCRTRRPIWSDNTGATDRKNHSTEQKFFSLADRFPSAVQRRQPAPPCCPEQSAQIKDLNLLPESLFTALRNSLFTCPGITMDGGGEVYRVSYPECGLKVEKVDQLWVGLPSAPTS
jgi:hypothetical protein